MNRRRLSNLSLKPDDQRCLIRRAGKKDFCWQAFILSMVGLRLVRSRYKSFPFKQEGLGLLTRNAP
ncbi:hypothetical protein FRX31_033361 [Thalictrum thalictroides]|uniref:Uncharacterized protein n=1 Tax=Thalictrum thalictroides TaxID=46969 RepID=A0A7J6UX45_THATH|nr:hypothetical protein FRX31_033361 [Thalictrum thalictroides]